MVQSFTPRQRKVRILATLGPASANAEMIAELHRAGADAFRVNMSHGDHEGHAKVIAALRQQFGGHAVQTPGGSGVSPGG